MHRVYMCRFKRKKPTHPHFIFKKIDSYTWTAQETKEEQIDAKLKYKRSNWFL